MYFFLQKKRTAFISITVVVIVNLFVRFVFLTPVQSSFFSCCLLLGHFTDFFLYCIDSGFNWSLVCLNVFLILIHISCDQINGMTTENLSLLETKHLVEKSRGKLTMTVLRDSRRFLVSIPEVEDSAPNSEEDRRRDSSSELEGEQSERGGGRMVDYS